MRYGLKFTFDRAAQGLNYSNGNYGNKEDENQIFS